MLGSCISAVKWDAHDVKNTLGNARRCNPGRQSSCRFHAGNRAEVAWVAALAGAWN